MVVPFTTLHGVTFQLDMLRESQLTPITNLFKILKRQYFMQKIILANNNNFGSSVIIFGNLRNEIK
jgi:hypothetical protein